MAITPTPLYRGQPAATSTALYTVPAATTVIITHIAICNVTGAAATFSIANCAAGAAEADANRFMKNASVAPSSTLYVDLAMVLSATDVLRATCSVAATLTFIVSGVVSA